ncbi:protein phosphatase PHLPP-like protein [Trichonephila inaurata madagascariensis]|uniref:Protein phosphatase PHLPP-like protein n=1 Tax=Trichonephila inaurata madagascariensis TaxID=2747483 RepID=A0A8X7C2D5_9ARAC|nr:protein phosphatase PHLPP-like protein [Trichonephila inaurata madagascariensis]
MKIDKFYCNFRLKRLHCDFNHLGSLPLDWSSLVSLTSLTLSNNRLDLLPTTIWTLQCLEVLNLQRNRICVIDPLPEGAASRLKELRLSWNRLSGTLDLSPLVNISHLDVSHNDLEDLEISKLYKLESLDVSQNALKALNLEGSRVRTLQADGNGLEIITCKQVPLYLEKLDISHNNFEYLPEWITEAKSLHTILADHNHLSHVPIEIFSCCNLMDLRLNHNLLVKLPDFLTQCHMKSLSLQYNKFEKLPYNFFWALPCLETLNLSYNSLKSLPVSCDSIINLKELLLSGNELSDLRNLVNLLKLSRIECLHLSCNQIKELPEDILDGIQAVTDMTRHVIQTAANCSSVSTIHRIQVMTDMTKLGAQTAAEEQCLKYT